MQFTVYNCGTAFNRDSLDIIPQLWRETTSANMINDGPGSTGKAITKPAGLIAGWGVNTKVRQTVRETKEKEAVLAGILAAHQHLRENLVVNMVGWSRGAVACFKTANALYKDPATRNIKVNIFAIDPVPGGTAVNNAMWKNIDVTPNIGMCSAIYAQHDRRGLFSPYMPAIPVVTRNKEDPFPNPIDHTKRTQFDIDIMPGNHSDLVMHKANNLESYQLVKHLAKQFLISRGTVFSNMTVLNDIEILDKYATIAGNFSAYAKGKRKEINYFKGKRIIKGKDGKKAATMFPIKPTFFINGHHREIFQKYFPGLAKAVDRRTENPNFDLRTILAQVQNEINRLQFQPFYYNTLDQVSLHFNLSWG